MAYTPDRYNSSLPDDTIIAETAQAEFRMIKSFYQGVVGRTAAPVTQVNTLVQATPFLVSIPAGALGLVKRLRFTVEGLVSNGSGVSVSVAATIQYGATALVSAISLVAATNGNYAFRIVTEMGALGATNLQGGSGEIHLFADSSTGGIPRSEVSGYPKGFENHTMAVNSTIAQDFALFTALSLADPTFFLYISSATLEWR